MRTEDVYKLLSEVKGVIDSRLMKEEYGMRRIVNADEVELKNPMDPDELQKRYALYSFLDELERVVLGLDYLERPVLDVGVLRRNENGRYELNGLEFTSGRDIEILVDDQEGDEPSYWVHTTVEHDGTDYYAVYGHKRLDGLRARTRR